jgi:hypothetical protein
MYIQSKHAKEVGVGTFARAFWAAITPPDRAAKTKLTKLVGSHVLYLNLETALRAVCRFLPGRQPGKKILVDQQLYRKAHKIIEKSGLVVVVFSGQAEFLSSIEQKNVIALLVTDHFDQGGRRIHKALSTYTGLTIIFQHRLRPRKRDLGARDIMLWQPRELPRSSGGTALVYGEDNERAMIGELQKHNKALRRISNTEFVKDVWNGLFGKVQSSRHIKRRPALVLAKYLIKAQRVI